MTKQDILNTTGLSEEEFYQRYPDQETFCSEYPEMCPDMMDDENVSDEYVVESDYDDSLYEAQDGVQTTAPYTDYNQYKNAMQTYGAESNKAATYNSFQNDLYNQSGKTRGSRETARQLGDMFNTLSPEQQDALAQKYGAQFITNTPSANRRNYVNSMEMTVPGKGTGYYSFPTNDVVYGSKDLVRPNYEFSKITAPQYKMPATPPVKNSFQPAQIINNIGASYKDPASLNASNGNLPIPKYSLNSTMKKVGATNQPFVTSTPSYSSIVDLLKARKLDSSFTNRKKLAEEAGIKNYTGSASQNMDLINRMDNFNPYSTEMKLGGENMFVNGGLVKYQKKGEVKQNPPKQFTDFKKFQRAERLYTDSLNTYNNFPAFDKNMTALYNNMMPNVITEDDLIKLNDEYVKKYINSAKKNKINRSLITSNNKIDKTLKKVSITDNNGNIIENLSRFTDFAVKPKQPVVFKPALTHPIEHLERMEMMTPSLNGSNIQMQGQLLPIPQMRLPQRGNIPFYGTGNSIIGYTDGNMQFYPAQQYTGAPNNQLNLQDKELLDNPEMLQRYVLSKDNYNFELGGINIHPAMRTNFKQGGYYGMDGKLHRAKGSGTYVMNGGYYFQDGGGAPVASPATPPGAMGDPAAVPQSSLVDNNMPNPDGTFNVNNDYDYYGGYNEDDAEDYGGFQTQNERALKRQARRQERRNAQYETPDLGGLDESQYEEQPEEEVTAEPFDASNYSSAIDPSTGFTKWSKNNQALTNIKKQDPALWGQLKNEGKGARFRTGQTDIQKFARTAGKIGSNLEFGVNLASAVGNLLNNRNEQRNLNNSAINQGSTASMYTNPQSAGKGDYGQTGSSYGNQNPYSVGARSFKGMYGKYGMEVPRYDVGGLVPQFATLTDVGLESLSPDTFNVNSSADYLPAITPDFTNFVTSPKPIIESTGVYRDNKAVNQTADNNDTVATLDPDYALQAVAGIESGSKPGQTKVGMPTKLVGEGGKKASASGTYQITGQTLQEIFNKDKNISSKYKNFNTFKNAFDTDPKVEYEAAKSLMSEHIKNYGIYALGAWYYPEFARKAAKGDKSVFDVVPRRDFGNRVKWGDDFKLKLDAYNKAAGTNYTPNTIFNAPKPVAQKKYTTPPGENPMARKTFRDFQTEFSGITNMGIWGDARHKEKKSDHNTADALDIGIKDTNQGNQVVQKLIKEAKDRNIKYIIFNSRIWDAKTNTWSAYDGDNPHKTHVHTSFNRVKKQLGGQVMEMDEDEIKQFLKAGGQLEFLD